MKTLNKIWGTGLLAFLLIAIAPARSRAQDISSQDFYDSLAQYGTWVSDPQYGDVWVPDAEDDFMPYGTQGHWVLTEYGNTWVSDYPWGWATFHYGRWHYDDYYGWEWIPGYEWAPAWVSWREGGGYYGWAPLMPGISLSIVFGGGYHIPNRYWVCVPQAYINTPNIRNYYVPHTRVVNIIHNTTIINNTYVRGNNKYIAGPRVEDIQRVTHQRPQVYRISNANAPGAISVRNKEVNIYRPAVKKAPDAHPARVVDGQAYRQQNPDQRIASAAKTGRPAFNHDNATKLATVARSTTPDNKVVRINEHNNPAQPVNRPNGVTPTQPDNRADHNRPGQPAATPTNPAPGQPAANPNDRGNRRGGQSNRPNPAQVQPATPPVAAPVPQANPAQPQANPPAGQNTRQNHRGSPENRPNMNPVHQPNPPANNVQQAQQQANQQQAQAQQAQQQAQQQQAKAQQAQQQAQQQQRQQQQAQRQAQRLQQQQQQAPPQAQPQIQQQQQQAQQQAQQQQRQAQQAQQQAQQQQRQAQQQQQQAQQQQRQAQQAQQQAQQAQRQQQQAQQQAQRQQQQPRPQPQPRQAPPPRPATPPPPKPEEHKPPGQ